MFFERKNRRFTTFARASVCGPFSERAVVTDLSVTGCRLEGPSIIDISPGKQLSIKVFPETAAKIGEFELTVEAKWVKVKSDRCEAGFSIIKSPKGKFFQRYVDYLAYRAEEGKELVPDEPLFDIPA